MEITAKAKYIRMSPRKLRLVARAVAKLSPLEALAILPRVNKRAAQPLGKTIKSALGNAVGNLGLKGEDLKIQKIEIGEGPAYKRWRVVSRGRIHPIKKRTSHITVVLTAPDEKPKAEKKVVKKVEKKKEVKRGTKG